MALAAIGCGTPAALSSLDGGPEPLVCATPMTQPLVVATTGTLAGAPMAGVTWLGGRCAMTTDDHAPGLVLLIGDFTGTWLQYLTALAGSSGWQIDSSTTGTGGSSYIPDIPRDTDITLQMSRATDHVSITFRVSTTNVLTLLDMHRT